MTCGRSCRCDRGHSLLCELTLCMFTALKLLCLERGLYYSMSINNVALDSYLFFIYSLFIISRSSSCPTPNLKILLSHHTISISTMAQSPPFSEYPRSNTQPTGINQLAEDLQRTNLDGSRPGKWNFFPPGTSLKEQLFILAGVDDYKLQGQPAGAVFKDNITGPRAHGAPIPQASVKSLDCGSTRDIAQAMKQHLALLVTPICMENDLNAITIESLPRPSIEVPKMEYVNVLHTSKTHAACWQLRRCHNTMLTYKV